MVGEFCCSILGFGFLGMLILRPLLMGFFQIWIHVCYHANYDCFILKVGLLGWEMVTSHFNIFGMNLVFVEWVKMVCLFG